MFNGFGGYNQGMFNGQPGMTQPQQGMAQPQQNMNQPAFGQNNGMATSPSKNAFVNGAGFFGNFSDIKVTSEDDGTDGNVDGI